MNVTLAIHAIPMPNVPTSMVDMTVRVLVVIPEMETFVKILTNVKLKLAVRNIATV